MIEAANSVRCLEGVSELVKLHSLRVVARCVVSNKGQYLRRRVSEEKVINSQSYFILEPMMHKHVVEFTCESIAGVRLRNFNNVKKE
jgi:hypothetical protein